MPDLLAGPGGEPDWALLLSDPLDLVGARGHFGRIVAELRLAGRWTSVNDHAVTRLVMAYVIYDRSAREVLDRGAVVPSPKTRVPQYNLHFAVMTQAAATAAALEAELMLSPRKRGKTPMKSAGGGVRAKTL
jgi:phage terminase small subunit